MVGRGESSRVEHVTLWRGGGGLRNSLLCLALMSIATSDNRDGLHYDVHILGRGSGDEGLDETVPLPGPHALMCSGCVHVECN